MSQIPLGGCEASRVVGEEAVVVEDRIHGTTMRAIIVHDKRTSSIDIV
ncbi:MAG: hypothetical protein AAGD33_01735 [Actinomycetota bacterium]